MNRKNAVQVLAPRFFMHGGKMKLLWIYLLVMNVFGLLLMGMDKQRAKKKLWRIPEKHLFLCSLLGGSIGTWVGMYLFRHKTKHWYFVVGMPLICVLQAAIGFGVWYRFIH